MTHDQERLDFEKCWDEHFSFDSKEHAWAIWQAARSLKDGKREPDEAMAKDADKDSELISQLWVPIEIWSAFECTLEPFECADQLESAIAATTPRGG